METGSVYNEKLFCQKYILTMSMFLYVLSQDGYSYNIHGLLVLKSRWCIYWAAMCLLDKCHLKQFDGVYPHGTRVFHSLPIGNIKCELIGSGSFISDKVLLSVLGLYFFMKEMWFALPRTTRPPQRSTWPLHGKIATSWCGSYLYVFSWIIHWLRNGS